MIADGYYLLGKDDVEVLKPDYVPALDGEYGRTINKNAGFYIGNDQQIIKVPRRKRKAWSPFES